MDVNQIIEEYKKSKQLSFYEKFCNFAYNIFRLKLSKEEEELYAELNKFSNLRIPPASNFSAAILTFLIGIFFVIISAMFFGSAIGFVSFILISVISFFVYYYPNLKAKLIRNFASSEMMHAIIYMSISLKQVPNLERAVYLAATNLRGEIGKDFRRVLANFFTGQATIKEGLNEIINKWYKEAREFCEALKLLIAYSENPHGSENLIKEAIRIMHDENFERMERYARSLRLPSTILVGLGIILPLLSLTILPLFSIFFPEIFSFMTLVTIFNVLLPSILLVVVVSLISTRPLTSSFLIIKDPFEINVGNLKINLIHVAIAMTILLSIIVFPSFVSMNNTYELCAQWANTKFNEKPSNLNLSEEECKEFLIGNFSLVFLALASLSVLILPISLIIIFSTKEVLLKRKFVEKLESEFPSVIYQTGYYLKIGNPLEVSISKGIEKFKKFEIARFFEKLLSILSYSGNLKEAVEKVLKDYPSSLIKSAFDIILESYKKGYRFAGETMIIISEYLSSLLKLQAKIEELVGDVTSNLKFIVTFLMPIIVGTGISLVIILLSLIVNISFVAGSLSIENQTEALPISLPFVSTNVSMLSFGSITFSLGLYVIEMIIIASLLIVGLESGIEKYNLLSFLGKTLLISFGLYAITVLFGSIILYPMVSGILQTISS